MFGDLSGLGTLGRSALTHWLALFQVESRAEIVGAILQNNDRKIAENAHFTMLSAHCIFIWRMARTPIAAMLQWMLQGSHSVRESLSISRRYAPFAWTSRFHIRQYAGNEFVVPNVSVGGSLPVGF